MVGCLLLVGSLLVGQGAAASTEELKAEVGRLVRQLDSPKLDQREAAEAELLRRGPAVLDLLPPPTDRTPAEVQQRLGRIRQKLERLAADAVAEASTITLHAAAMPIEKVLKEFEAQSGNTIIYQPPRSSPPLAEAIQGVRLEKTPFWLAFDQFLGQAGLTLAPCSQPRALGVVTTPIVRSGRAAYSGPFRFEPIAVARRGAPPNGNPSLLITLSAEWEPRLRVISLVQRLADFRAADDEGNLLPVVDSEVQQEVPVAKDMIAVKLDVPLRLPDRPPRQIASLKGRLLATIAGKVETFHFEKLAAAKNVERRIAGVTVTLEQVRKDNQAWDVCVRARYDDAGDALASHRQWIFENEAFLETADGKPIAYDSFETTAQEKNEVGVAYRFRTDEPLDQLSFVYKTPGTIITRGFDYQLRDIAIPK